MVIKVQTFADVRAWWLMVFSLLQCGHTADCQCWRKTSRSIVLAPGDASVGDPCRVSEVQPEPAGRRRRGPEDRKLLTAKVSGPFLVARAGKCRILELQGCVPRVLCSDRKNFSAAGPQGCVCVFV
jgi:hypothetical protein